MEDIAEPLRSFRKALDPAMHGHPGFGYRQEIRDGMVIERDVAVPVLGGLRLYADVFRPEGAANLPAIVCYAPFGKHPHVDMAVTFPNSGIPSEKLSEYTPFEVFDPLRWTAEGFAICVVDGVGNWYSEGTARWFGAQEARAGYDAIEWFAARPWCNGRIGWGGVSYYAMTAWQVAALCPPSLAAILPWDAASDNYRETNFTGGIPLSGLTHNWMLLTGVGLGEVEDWEIGCLENPLFNDFWNARIADWSAIQVPTYAASEWGNNLHLRGTVEAWTQLSSPHKYLDLCGGKEWAEFYSEWAFERQRRFLGEFLKGEDNGVASGWPPVRVALRTSGSDWHFRGEPAWPLPDTEYRAYFLDAGEGTLGPASQGNEATRQYASTDPGACASFDLKFEAPTEITGHSRLRLWISLDMAADADLFVCFEKLDQEGNVVPFVFSQMSDDGPAAVGYLRASHRELDEARSTSWRPYHKHERRLYLGHRQPVPVEIEIWPTNIMFEAGESLRLIVRGSEYPLANKSGFVLRHWPLVNEGNHIIHTGGEFDSQLILPVIGDRP